MRRLLVVPTVVLVALGLTGMPAGASNQWGTYHWASGASKLVVPLGDNVDGTWNGILTAVSGDWQTSSIGTTVVAGATKPKPCKAETGRVEVCNDEYGWNGWLGLAQIWIGDGHIQRGVAKVNDTYFNHPVYDDAVARRHVLCQEVGHTLGLQHDHTRVSCMGGSADSLFDPNAVDPSSHDLALLDSIHSHSDSTDTGSGDSGGPPCSKKPDHPNCDPAKFGAGHGNETVHVERGPDGQTVVTFVLWA